MIEKKITIRNNAGLHTRPAATIVKIAAQYNSEFFINKDGMNINGKSIIGVMTLAAAKGATLTLTFEGDDQNEMAEAMANVTEKQ
mgnify:CR=1 FL=1